MSLLSHIEHLKPSSNSLKAATTGTKSFFPKFAHALYSEGPYSGPTVPHASPRR